MKSAVLPVTLLSFAASGIAQVASLPSPTPDFLVDQYGQNARVELPGRVTSDDELRADVEKQILVPLDSPALDSYGGLAGSGKKYGMKSTGFFRVDAVGGHQVFVTPEGNVFFHLAVCGIAMTDDYTLVTGREKDFEWLPPKDGEFTTAWRPGSPGVVSFYVANWIRKFGRPFNLDEWTGQVVDRVRSWGFNSAGAFSAYTEAMRSRNFPHVSWLPMGQEFGARMLPDKVGASEVLDPFVPGTEEALDKAFAQKIAPAATDPLIIGYFNGNEQHLELLAKLIPRYQASKVAAKKKLVDFLQAEYGDIAAFQAAWKLPKAPSSFDELGEQSLTLSTEAASADMKKFCRLYLETYFSLVERVFRKYDKNHLLIGNRLTPGTANNKDVVEISGAHVDVLSVNYYSYEIDQSFLKQIHDWSGGKPIILSEWYFSSTDTGLGGGKEVRNQAERALGYRHYVEQAAALSFVIGSEWFIFNDQALTGRFFEGLHGEGNNTGLVNVADRPYDSLVAATRETGRRIYDVVFGKEPPFVFDDPRFAGGKGASKIVNVPRALPGLKLDGSTTNWPGRPAESIESNRIALGNPDPRLRGDFRLCWDEKNLYFLIQIKDPTPGLNDKKPNALWNADGVELFFGSRNLDQKGTPIFGDVQILVGAGSTPKIFIEGSEQDAAQCQVVLVKDVSRDGYVLEVALSWTVLKTQPKAGLQMLFDVAIDNSDDGQTRKQQLVWNGSAKNSGDRGSWGRTRLVEN